ncbi:hypothetical protein [Tenacibaculum aiptasiae]|uniref:hypothetical protein n=1 Tax=Tenacibaculum aiptasiae TaxID=426481 RepID=UPI003B594695
MEVKITKEILFYVNFLNLHWSEFIKKVGSLENRDEWQKKELINDWLQFNWEIFVESSICKDFEFLTGYGIGADCNIDSERVRFPNKNATHTIKCVGKFEEKVFDFISKKKILIEHLEFFQIISLNKNLDIDVPPFEYVLLQDSFGEYYKVNIDSIDFYKVKIADNKDL